MDISALLDMLWKHMDTKQRMSARRIQGVLSRVRWNYGPHTEVEAVDDKPPGMGVSALSGVVESKAGPCYAFSILVEYPAIDGLNTRCWKPMQDDVALLLAELMP